jgi:hypothetical protein
MMPDIYVLIMTSEEVGFRGGQADRLAEHRVADGARCSHARRPYLKRPAWDRG